MLDDDLPDSTTPCATHLEVYLDPLLEEPPKGSAFTADLRQRYDDLVGRARALCAACPLLTDCLYKAVVQADVAGFVGCTTPPERDRIRGLLGIKVTADEFDQYAGTRAARRPVDHDDVLRMRHAYPDESLELLAQRLECSLSTVKRHLRRARQAGADDAGTEDVSELPSVDAVLDAFDEVIG